MMDIDADPAGATDVERADAGYGYADTRTDDTRAKADGDAPVVRSEEELSVDKVQRDAGKVRLRKYVVTEDLMMTVPVRKEVARVTREKIIDGDVTKNQN